MRNPYVIGARFVMSRNDLDKNVKNTASEIAKDIADSSGHPVRDRYDLRREREKQHHRHDRERQRFHGSERVVPRQDANEGNHRREADRRLQVAAVPRPAARSPDTLKIRRLRRAELPSGTAALAHYLIGKILVHDLPRGRLAGRIVETEAYVVGDAAGHAFRGMSPRNRSLFLKRGHAYVYFAYGSCYCLNVSSERPGVGAGVLLRALEPLEGIAAMERHRGTVRRRDLARGPGRLAEAMRVDLRLDGADLCDGGPLWLGEAKLPRRRLGKSVRIGITKEAHRLLRFYEKGNPFVSGPGRLRA